MCNASSMIYDIIVFEKLHFHPSTRKQEASVFKNLALKSIFERCISGDLFLRIRVDGALVLI